MSQKSVAQRIAARDAANALFEVGASDAYLQIRTSANAVLVQVALNETTVMGATNGSAISVMNTPKSGDAWAGLSIAPTAQGVADNACITNRNGVAEELLTVGLADADVIMVDTTVGLNDVVFSAAPQVTEL